MNKYELINITNYNPSSATLFKPGRSDREEIRYWKCRNKKHCEAYKRGRCIMFYHLLVSDSCPYGIKEKVVGFTKLARKCGELERKARNEYPDLFYALKEETGFAQIGEYVLLPISYIRDVRNPFMSKNSDFWYEQNDRLINAKYYNANIIRKLCVYRPNALFSGYEIEAYRKKVLPEFLERLKKYDWQMYQEVLKIYPEAENIANEFSYIGRNALLNTLSPGKVKIKTDLCEWDGETIKFLGNPVLFGAKGTYYLKPDSNVVATICDEKTITGNTLLVDD